MRAHRTLAFAASVLVARGVRAEPVGIGVEVGGGITGFTDPTMRATTSVGGLWAFRATLGTRATLALELDYFGSATRIHDLLMIGNAFESDLRLNMLPHGSFEPFAFVGVGGQRYMIDDVESDMGVNQQTDLLVVPIGAGIDYRHAGIVVELRSTYRDAPPMNTWEASLAIGHEL